MIDLRPAQQYLGISGKITEGVPAFVDRAFPELYAWLREHAVEPAGPPFLRYDEVDSDGQPLELEVGVPVEGATQGDERVCHSALPAGRYLTYLHVGPYRSETLPDLAAARERLLTWAEGHELAPLSYMEHFRIGPVEEPDFTKWETEFAYLIV
ncbi:MAG TPA: GyrI-like domain-containing protein [Thermoleophilaceae bacterium]